jgi:CxxC-x17-CxxC domain-containing protein
VDEKLRELGLPQLPMTLLRRDRSSRDELRGRLDSIGKTRPAKEAEQDAERLKASFKQNKGIYGLIQQSFAEAVHVEDDFALAEQAFEASNGLRRIIASWRFAAKRGKLQNRALKATDELGDEAKYQREMIIEDALTVLRAELERTTASANRNARQQIQEFSSLLRRDPTRFQNFSLFDLLKTRPDRTAMLLQILPVWIMTPDDVARLFPCQPGIFDVVIIDEASQVDLPSITPILYRGKKVIVSGDTRQMRSRRFAFMSEAIALQAWHRAAMDKRDPEGWLQPTKQSLLDLAFPRAEEEVLLDEHFRSLPPIIEFSNHRWYQDKLRIMTDESRKRFGPPLQPVIELHHVKDGVISNGSQENQKEAEALVAKLKELLEHPAYNEATFGVICLFDEQVSLVQDLIADQIAPEHWEAHDIVVVNPDGFQGDERDVILYSLSFDNRLMSRSAIAARQSSDAHVQGMLNVCFTRARDEIHVFHSAAIGEFAFADGTPGAIGDWLQHCAEVQSRPRQQPPRSRLNRSDSQFEDDVASALRDRGYSVIQQYPACGFFIDMVIERDGRRLAVECDGELYHLDEHGQLKIEDLERQAILERASWEVTRIPYRRWKRDLLGQLYRIDAWFSEDPNSEDEPADIDAPSETKGEQIPVNPMENAIIQSIQESNHKEDEVLKRSREILGFSRLGNRIRSQFQTAAESLARRGLLTVEESEYFLTLRGRQAKLTVTASQRRARYQRRPSASGTRRLSYQITCSECGRAASVPFAPTPGRRVLCPSCFRKSRTLRR